ncbi:hypothetical protein [Bremerella sp. P1]|uniref:hypothetical protein n=1 Tax=Bremerella sp. P1 TaxID=3026424 RepID=UPI0023688D07|nr:hypothetical protein [Bremerella sp. P1]WDI43730.1 hypothetical protein PSR63_07190 [Bremerella sp. P1]
MENDYLSPLEGATSTNYYSWLDLATCEDDLKQIRQALRQKQAQLAALHSNGPSEQAERHKLKQAAEILLNSKRKADYDSTIALELKPQEESEPAFLETPKLAGSLPPLPQTVSSVPPPAPNKPSSQLSQDQIRWIGIACVLILLVSVLVVPFLLSSDKASEEVASDASQDVGSASTDVGKPDGSSVPSEAASPPYAESAESTETFTENASPSESSEVAYETSSPSESEPPEMGIPSTAPEESTDGQVSPMESPTPPKTSMDFPEAEFLAEINLPQLPSAEVPKPEPVEIGKVNESAQKELSMRLDSGACDLERLYRFELIPVSTSESPSWHVIVAVDDSSSKALGVPSNYRPLEEPVARFFVESDGSIKFEWNPSVKYPAVEQLRNARLLISAATKTHIVALRKAVRREGHVIALEDTVDEYQIHLPALPAPENIFLQLTQTDNIALPVEIEPDSRRINPNEPATVTLGAPEDTVKAQFRVALKVEDRNDLTITIVPRYFSNDRWNEFTDENVTNTINRLQRAISDGKREAQESLQAISALERQIASLSNRRPANVQEAGAISRALGQAKSEHKSHVSKVKRRSNQVPASYAALALLYRVAAMGQSLNNNAQLRYRVFAVGSTGEVDLIVADSTPPSTSSTGGFQIPNRFSSPIGDWILFSKPPMRYEFLSGGSFQVRDFISNKVTASGRWTQNESQITLEAQGRSVVYDLKDGVEMRSDDGIGLFRQIDAP